VHETRQRIVELLRLQGSHTVESLCAALGISRTAVKSHLTGLRAEGLVRRRGLRPGVRRPSNVYELTPEADRLFPKIYDDFAAALIDEIRQQRPNDLQGYLDRIADRWIARDLPRVSGLHGLERIERAKEILAERGFMPVLEQMPDGYQLHEHNCPLMRLTADYPEVCNMVHRWLEALLGTQLNRTQCLRLGDPFSAYMIPADSQARGGPGGSAQEGKHKK
jgi:predicted ArsR family transcriptional regulator